MSSALEAMSQLVRLARFSYIHEAHIAKGVLESNGIDVFLENQHSYAIEPNAFVSILVHRDDLAEAEELLQTLEWSGKPITNQSHQPTSTATPIEQRCPRCATVLPHQNAWLKALRSLLTLSGNEIRCKNCGFQS